jgi:hypothetical protein
MNDRFRNERTRGEELGWQEQDRGELRGWGRSREDETYGSEWERGREGERGRGGGGQSGGYARGSLGQSERSGSHWRANTGMYGGYAGGLGGGYEGSRETEHGRGDFGGYTGNQGRFASNEGSYGGSRAVYGGQGGYAANQGSHWGRSGGYGGSGREPGVGRERGFGGSEDQGFRGRDIGSPFADLRQRAGSEGLRSGGGFAGRGPKGYVRTDERIREDVCDRLSMDDDVDASEVEVRVENGEVTLEGTVPTRSMKHRAEDLTEDVAGVNDVHNRLRVVKGMLDELKDKLTGKDDDRHFANTGTKDRPANGTL